VLAMLVSLFLCLLLSPYGDASLFCIVDCTSRLCVCVPSLHACWHSLLKILCVRGGDFLTITRKKRDEGREVRRGERGVYC